MKKALIAAASLAAIAAIVPAAAQGQPTAAAAVDTGVYGNLNLGYADGRQANLDVIQGRLGYRFTPYIGVEGEAATGIKSDTDTIAGVDVTTRLRHEFAGYVVGFLPVMPNTDLLARIGYGTTRLKTSVAGISDADSAESWNFGVGAQHMFDAANGLRADYTRQEFNHDAGHADVWTVGYVRKF
ncbi:porin family protein [Phenylobacterium sp.]|uniref:porin family protein n=1 Tax=Phenylobacterium sp. TaxID=1871053 RepID=UPI0025D8252E|nr:porin family protein [Phenylobacterium sp.]